MSDQSLAKVGDVIEHGQDIPANVVLLRDQDNDLWRRGDKGQFRCLTDSTETTLHESPGWWPVKVVEVDPVPQPAARRLIGPAHAHLDAPCTDACYEPTGEDPRYAPMTDEQQRKAFGDEPAESGPVVLSLPQVPDGATLVVVSNEGDEVLFHPTEGGWQRGPNDVHGVWKLGKILDMWGEARPRPREPRTWPKIEAAPDDLPQALDLSAYPSGASPVRWVLNRSHEVSGMYVGPLGNHHTLPELRAVGWVTEVIEP